MSEFTLNWGNAAQLVFSQLNELFQSIVIEFIG